MNEKVADSTESLPSSSVMRRNLKGFATRFLLSTFLLRKLILKTSLVDLFRIYVSFFQCFTFVRADRNFLYFFCQSSRGVMLVCLVPRKEAHFKYHYQGDTEKLESMVFRKNGEAGPPFFWFQEKAILSGFSYFMVMVKFLIFSDAAQCSFRKSPISWYYF